MSFDTAISRIFSKLGTLATFTPVSGPVVSGIYVNFENQTQLQGGVDGNVMQVASTIEYILDDLGVTARNGDVFTVDGTAYTVGEMVSNDGFTAMVTVK